MRVSVSIRILPTHTDLRSLGVVSDADVVQQLSGHVVSSATHLLLNQDKDLGVAIILPAITSNQSHLK